jgi:hypothetical protein
MTVVLRLLPDAGKRTPRVVVDTPASETAPRLPPDGRELFFLNGDVMMGVAISTDPSARAGTPQKLFEGRFVRSPTNTFSYDVAEDGRFLRVQPMHSDPPANQIHGVLNWQEER